MKQVLSRTQLPCASAPLLLWPGNAQNDPRLKTSQCFVNQLYWVAAPEVTCLAFGLPFAAAWKCKNWSKRMRSNSELYNAQNSAWQQLLQSVTVALRFGCALALALALAAKALPCPNNSKKHILKIFPFSTHRRNAHGRTHVQKSSKPPWRAATWRQDSTTKAEKYTWASISLHRKMSFEKVWRRTSLCVAHSRIPTHGSDPSRAFHPSVCAVLTHACTGASKNHPSRFSRCSDDCLHAFVGHLPQVSAGPAVAGPYGGASPRRLATRLPRRWAPKRWPAPNLAFGLRVVREVRARRQETTFLKDNDHQIPSAKTPPYLQI